MKLYAVSAVIAGCIFAVYTGIQLQVQQSEREREEVQAPAAPAPKPKRLSFPADLAPAAQAKAVPGAAAFTPGPEPHKLVILKPDGTLHSWYENLEEDWQATSVESTELVLVIGKQKKIFIEHIKYPNGAPPITRYEFDLEVSVVEAKTGRLLANQMFKNVPREIARREAWETTALGRPVPLSTVFRWVSRLAKIGFPDEFDPTPIVNRVES